ncbi:hypothetical protein [Pseudolactococcus reticulitermitis]|uniref:Uncharacterized protein n=1 Tax=Pseudolactococcus reticulitermitis TaxID=2025039 RepID=A0A224X0N0_9LACT|nr:hypothetical protein [Lactococcus reticulitermitis]GAX47799.1 hypothetical protein RsY01_1403 [Lactococcus reticulitermitis]
MWLSDLYFENLREIEFFSSLQTFSFVYKPTNPGQAGQQLPTTGQTLPTTGQQLPRTGDCQNVFHLILGFLLVALVSFLSWVKLGKKFGKEMK